MFLFFQGMTIPEGTLKVDGFKPLELKVDFNTKPLLPAHIFTG
jgi:hypothetical protein